jgi:hypothetical protein
MVRRMLLALSFALMAIARTVAQDAHRQLWFDDARPLAKATRDLEDAYGWIVTYEDVEVVGADTKDVTAEVRRDHDPNARNKVIVPNGRPFGFTVDDGQARQPGQVGAGSVIANLLSAYHQSGNPGRFQGFVVRAGGQLVFHVVPIETRDVRGQSVAYRSPLETRISFPRTRQSIDGLLKIIEQKITEASGVPVHALPAGANNYFIQTQLEEAAAQETARDVLRRLLIQDTGKPFSWTMRCEPAWGCALNPHLVVAR